MPDPLTLNVNQERAKEDQQMEVIVEKALKKRKKKKTEKEAYSKLAMLVPSVSKVLNNASYGADAGGFKPSVPTDSGNGWADAKPSYSRVAGVGPSSNRESHEQKHAGWPGIPVDILRAATR